ncbi:efflux RND transporter periplasmic adaptor subunit [bacterium]|nr:efflux RND transporter periplasmic adaptor subunit [bacterium]
MSTRQRNERLPVLAIVCVAGAALIFYYLVYGGGIPGSFQKKSPETSGEAAKSLPVPSVIATDQPQRREFQRTASWFGQVEAPYSTHLRAPVDGQITTLAVADQQEVQTGDRIAMLGGPMIESHEKLLQVDIDSQKEQLKLAEQSVQRIEENVKEQLATNDQLLSAREAKQAIQGKLQKMHASLDAFRQQLVIDAPASGVFVNRQASQGELVRAGDPIGDIQDTHRLRIVARISLPDGFELEGASVSIADAREDFRAAEFQITPTTTPSGAMVLWITGPEVNARLRPGQSVNGVIAEAAKKDELAVPETAVIYGEDEKPVCFVSKADGYEKRTIKTGLTQDGWIEVISGISADDMIVTKGAFELYYKSFAEEYKPKD